MYHSFHFFRSFNIHEMRANFLIIKICVFWGGPFRPLFYFRLFYKQLTVNMLNKRCRWLDLNPGPLVSEATRAINWATTTIPKYVFIFLMPRLYAKCNINFLPSTLSAVPYNRQSNIQPRPLLINFRALMDHVLNEPLPMIALLLNY